MSARPKISGRLTSLAHAFVHAIVPRRVDIQEQQQLFERAGIKVGECVYCGAFATDNDHFRGLVKLGRPSGHFHTTDNLVPSCGPCNQSKGAADWHEWMTGNARGSPTKKGVQDIAQRIDCLSVFEAESKSVVSSSTMLRETAGAALWDAYWEKLAQIQVKLLEADKDAVLIRLRLDTAFGSAGSKNVSAQPG